MLFQRLRMCSPLRVGLRLLLIGIALSHPAHAAAPSTSRGEMSVAQLRDLLDKAPSDIASRRLLTAYLAGVGETAGILLDAAAGIGTNCREAMSLSAADVGRALKAARTGDTAETAATPLIVNDMLDRAGCRTTW